MVSIYDQIMRLLLEEKDKFGSTRAMCAAKGVNPSTVTRWFKSMDGEEPRSPNLFDVAKILDDLDILVIKKSDLDAGTNVHTKTENDFLKQQVEELLKKNEELLAEFHRQEGQIQMLMDFMNPKSKNGGLLAAILKDKE